MCRCGGMWLETWFSGDLGELGNSFISSMHLIKCEKLPASEKGGTAQSILFSISASRAHLYIENAFGYPLKTH